MAFIQLGNRRIEYRERPDSPKESYSGNTGKCSRTFDVAWTDRLFFLQGMMGWSEPVFGNTGTFQYIKRVQPVGYPAVVVGDNKASLWGKVEASNYWLYATAIDSIEPLGIDRSDRELLRRNTREGVEFTVNTKTDEDIFKHHTARISLSYEALPYRVADEAAMRSLGFIDETGQIDESTMWRYVSRTIQPSSEHLTLPFGRMKWDASAPTGLANTVATNQTGRIIPSMDIVYTWHQVPGIPDHAFSMIGSINSVVINDWSPGSGKAWSYAAGTLLFTGMELKTYRMATGIYCNDVIYRMKYFSAVEPHTGELYAPPRGHNHFLAFHGITGTAPLDYKYSYQKLVDGSSTGRGVYQEQDLRKLFTLPGL